MKQSLVFDLSKIPPLLGGGQDIQSMRVSFGATRKEFKAVSRRDEKMRTSFQSNGFNSGPQVDENGMFVDLGDFDPNENEDVFYQIEFEIPKVQEEEMKEGAEKIDANTGFVMSKVDLDQLIQRG